MQHMDMLALLVVAALQAPTLSERSGPNLEAGLSRESVLLQKPAQEAALHLGRQPMHLPLCDALIVDETCRKINGIDDGPSPKSALWAALADMLSAVSLEEAQRALNFPEGESEVGCMDLCTAAVQYVRSSGGVMPPSSHVACRTVHGTTTCDVEADPDDLIRRFGSLSDLDLPDEGPLTPSTEETVAGSEGDGPALYEQEIIGHTSKAGLAALLQRGARSHVAVFANATTRRGLLHYTAWEAVERIANLFCIYPNSGREEVVIISDEEPSLLQGGAANADTTVAYRVQEAKTWLATVVRNVNSRSEAAAQQKWFGGAGSLNTEQVRQRILQTVNFINREFAQGFYITTNADNAKQSACPGGAVAYVWRASARATTGYQETTGPRCNAGDNPRTTNCGIDQYGKYYMYLCGSYMQQSEDYQVNVLIHEAAHHAGPNDVTYDQNAMQRNYQQDQLMNAANYQFFAQSVAQGGCEDEDGNCRHYASYCAQDNIKAKCKRTCGLCSSGGGGGGSSGGSGGSCTDLDGNCRHYTSYCNTANIKEKCRQTCGLCSGGGGGGSCADTYGSCKWYKDNNYCSQENVRNQCQLTCGACR